jgi:TRAP-type C4-dicarboxylate transport system permease small subunit
VRLMNFVDKGIDALTQAFAVIAGVSVVLMLVHVNFDVILRATINEVPPGTIVFVSKYYMVLLVCLPLAFVERSDDHIKVDVFTGLLPERVQHVLAGIIFLPSALLFGLVAYASYIEAMQQFQRGTFVIEQDIRIPIWIGYFALPIGYGLGAMLLSLRFVRFLTGSGHPPTSQSLAPNFDTNVQVDKLNHD